MNKIIHIGAGSGTELADYIAAGARDIILVEPLPSLTSVLKQKVASIEEERLNIHVLEAAITDDPSASQLLEFNLPGTASLREPKALKTLFPGLKNIARHSVQTLSACELVDHFGPTDTDTALLVIEAPGEALAIIQSLAEADQLKRFRHIHFTSNPEPFYAGSGTAKEVLTLLAQQGYEQLGMDETDPDWMRWRLQRSPLQDEVDALTLQLTQRVQQSAAYHAELEKLRQAYNQQTDELNTVREDAAQQQQTNEQLEVELAELRKASRAQMDALQTALADATQHMKAHEALKSELVKLRQQHESTLSELENNIQVLQQQLDQQVQEKQQLQETLETTQVEAAQHKKAHETLKSELVQLRQQHESTLNALENNIQTLQQQLDRQVQEKQQLQETLETAQAEAAQHKKAHEALKSELVQLRQQHESTLSELENNIQTLQQQLDQQAQEKQQLLQNKQHNETAISQLEQRVSQMFEHQATLVQQSVSALGQHVTRCFNDQRQNFQTQLGLNAYLETGRKPLTLGGWSIDTGLATHLVEKLTQENYDLIIEFGSGSSTLLMARVLANSKINQVQNLSDKALEYDTPQGSGKTNFPGVLYRGQQDLPQRILSFEQDEGHWQQLHRSLQQEGLDHLVELVLAPLIPTHLTGQQGNTPLFYGCEQKLAGINQLFEGRQAKILILVDGPHSPQGNLLVREPALASVLQYLSVHKLTLLLDDYQRDGEQQVAKHWCELCDQRGLKYEQVVLATEKSAFSLTINA